MIHFEFLGPPSIEILEQAKRYGDDSEVTVKKSKIVLDKIGCKLIPAVEDLLNFPAFLQLQMASGKLRTMKTVPGHLWNIEGGYGPKRADVMVLGKMPGRDEINQQVNFCGPSGQFLREKLLAFGASRDDLDSWYITNLLKFSSPLPEGKITAGLIKACEHLLLQELAIVKPKYILCLGSEPTKWLFGKGATTTKLIGAVSDYAYQVYTKGGSEMRTAKVVCSNHPAQVLKMPETTAVFETGARKFLSLVSGGDAASAPEVVDHRVVDNLKDLRAAIKEADEYEWQQKHGVVAVDAEWHGQHPQNDNAYLRSIQFSAAPSTGICVRLAHAGGEPAFKEGLKAALKELARFFARKRLCGHFLFADLEWFEFYGLKEACRAYEAPRYGRGGKKPWELTKWEGGFDTGMAAHAINETDDFKLEVQATRLGCPRYDKDLTAWKEQYCNEHGIKAKDMEGYGWCPAEILEAYSIWDCDATIRLYESQQKLLDKDAFGLSSRKAFWIAMRSIPGVLEINTTGLVVDKERFDYISNLFYAGTAELRAKLRQLANWPSLNTNSHEQVREFLFGEQNNGKKDEKGDPVRLRPGPVQLHLVDCDSSDDPDLRPLHPIRQKAVTVELFEHAIASRAAKLIPRFLIVVDKAHSKPSIVQVLKDTRSQMFSQYNRKHNKRVMAAYLVTERSKLKQAIDEIRSFTAVFLVGDGAVETFKQLMAERNVPLEAMRGARSLYLSPVFATGKRLVEWQQAIADLEERETYGEEVKDPAAATGVATLAMLLQQPGDHIEAVQTLADYRTVVKVSETVFRMPEMDETGNPELGDDGKPRYKGGLGHYLCGDGRIRTRIWPTAETRRWKSSSPPMQNISKKREAYYRRIFGSRHVYPLRSCFTAPPGYVIIEADYSGAELFGMACMSGDANMMDHCLRGRLEKSDPNYYDIHSNVAKLAFKLDCEPTQKGLEEIGRSEARDLAKVVIFSACYGAGAPAIALKAKLEGTEGVTVDTAQAIIDTILAMYPGLEAMFNSCRSRSANPRWLCGAFGGYRRFPPTTDRKVAGGFERSAMNFPIQNLVADAINRSVDRFMVYRKDNPEWEDAYRMALQIHDALMFIVKIPFVDRMIDTVIPKCMSADIPVYPTFLDGRRIGTGPYYFGYEYGVYLHWGEKPSVYECDTLGISRKYAPKPKKQVA